MYCCRALGFGEPKPGLTTSGWAADRQKVLRTVCFYCSRMDFENKLRVIWSAEPKFYMTDYMKWRISNSSRFALLKYMLNHIQLDYLLNFFCLRRGSLIVATKK